MPQILQLQDPWNWFALDVTIKATVVLLLAAGLIAATRFASAAWQHRIWSLAIAGIVVLPLVQLATPGWLRPVVPQQWLPVSAQSSHAGPTNSVAYTESIATVALGEGLLAPERDRARNGFAATERSLMQPTGQESRFDEGDKRRIAAAVAPASRLATNQSVNWLFVIWCAGVVMRCRRWSSASSGMQS